MYVIHPWEKGIQPYEILQHTQSSNSTQTITTTYQIHPFLSHVQGRPHPIQIFLSYSALSSPMKQAPFPPTHFPRIPPINMIVNSQAFPNNICFRYTAPTSELFFVSPPNKIGVLVKPSTAQLFRCNLQTSVLFPFNLQRRDVVLV